MKNRSHINYSYGLLAVAVASVVFFSCVRESGVDPAGPGADPERYVRICFGLPAFERPSTRMMDDAAERQIDAETLNLLVFSYSENRDGTISEKYEYTAPIQGSVSYDRDNRAMVVAKLAKSPSGNEKYRIVAVANYDMSDVEMRRGVTEKRTLLSRLDYASPGPWNAGDDYRPFPMWGESDPIAVTEKVTDVSFSLFRALARIDVGLDFISGGASYTDQARGLDHFKLKEIGVYRTYNGGYAAPLVDDFLSVPSIPSGAARRADDDPLPYTLAGQFGENSYVREIYLPEAGLPASPGNDNMHCIVIGGFYEGSATLSYYRLDFAVEPGRARDYLPILRNHRYVFNITQVRGPGFASARSALLSNPTVSRQVEYGLVSWDETIHEMEVQGQYYLGLERSELVLGHRPTDADPSNRVRIGYQTNYPLSAVDPMTFTWDSGASTAFEAAWDGTNREIVVGVGQLNDTHDVRRDVLTVHLGSFAMRVNVRQEHVNYNYTLNCESVALNGTYENGGRMGPEHFITLSITAEDRSIQGSRYVIETEDPHNYGISFHAEGVFDFSHIPEGQPLTLNGIRLQASGTLDTPENVEAFTLTIRSDSPSGSYCQATIRLVTKS